MSIAEGPAGAVPGELLASGRDADVYALGADRVLRRYRCGGDVAAEAALMSQARRAGFPAPLVYAAAGPDLVLERLAGPTMLAALLRGGLASEAAGEVLADLHQRLHALPAPSGRSGVRIIHLDLHPENVILTPHGPVVIDWRNATEGPPDLDLAMSALILAEAAEGSFARSGTDPAELAEAARATLASFLSRSGGDPWGQLEVAVATRAADPALSAAERDRLGSAAALVRAGVPDGYGGRSGAGPDRPGREVR